MINTPIFRRTLLASIASIGLILVFLFIGIGTLENPVLLANQGAGGGPVSGIVFVREEDQTGGLWIADADGQNERQIAKRVIDYTIRPGGAEIAYATQPDNEPSKLEIVNLANGQVRQLAGSPDESVYTPAWSPADGIIVYERRTITAGGTGAPKLWIAQPDGTTLGPVIKGAEVVAYGANWSPDGARLGFVDALTDEIVIFNFTDLLRRVPFSGDFDWSPDGKRLVISALIEGSDTLSNKLIIYDLDAPDTKKEIELTSPADADDFTPRWSPDGKQVVFVRRAREFPQGQVAIIDVDKAGDPNAVRLLTSGGDVDNINPLWSPDGKTLLWTRLEVGTPGAPSSVWSLKMPEGSEPTRLIDRALQPRWIK